ncbi:MAG: hypothetical protein IH840_16275, partial [Candidatus Heimdallarchaeota archaeon]|nr:hypothetical protein [Candidatus Heimdallarchaeota archaeon]
MINKKITKAIFMISILLYSFNNTTGSIHVPPRMNSSPPNFVSYSEGSTGNTLTWVFEAEESNDDPANYTVKIDDIGWLGHVNQIWADNVPIVVNIDGLLPGTHNVEIEVWDSGTQQGFAAATFDTLIVEVLGFDINNAKIGFLSPVTGFVSFLGQDMVNSGLLAIDDLNARYPT